MKVKLKDGQSSIANAFFDLNPGTVVDIPDALFNSEVMDKVGGKVIEPITPTEVVEKSFKQELIDLKGIGPKIAEQILKLTKTKEGLAKIPKQTLIDELRDDVIPVLDKYLGKK